METERIRHLPVRVDETEVALAKQAFERLRPTLAEIPADRVERVRLDLEAVVVVALQVSRVVARSEVRARLGELPRSTFHLEDLDRLRELSLALWHACAEANDDEARAAEARALSELVETGRALKAEMLRVLAFHLAKSPGVLAQLDSIRSGRGHKVLASDLTRLANLYLEHQDVLEQDRTEHRGDDSALAQSVASRILVRLGQRTDVDWTDLLARLWTRLHEVYERVGRAGRFVFHGEELALAFPSLHAATRAKRRANGSRPKETSDA